jgi:hypothetical protein
MLIDLEKNVNQAKDELEALKLLLSNKVLLENESNKYRERANNLVIEKEKYRKMSLQLCQKLVKEAFKISGRQRVNQNAELSKQLDDLSSQDEQDDFIGSREDFPLETPTSQRSEDRDIFTPPNIANVSFHELPPPYQQQQDAFPLGNQSATNENDPSLIWKLIPKKKIMKNIKTNTVTTDLQVKEQSFSIAEI